MKAKNIIYLLLIVTTVIGIFSLAQKTQKKEPSPEKIESKTLSTTNKSEKNVQTINYKDKTFKVSFLEVKNIDGLYLIANFDQKVSSKEINQKNGCSGLVNAGFYSKDFKPIGLFISEGERLNPWQQNKLFNGVLSINVMAVPRITRETPRDPLRIALQSGPVLVENSNYLFPSPEIDKDARRIVAFISGENRLYFAVFYEQNYPFKGPYLSDLASLLKELSDETGLLIADAINLDGGGASVFIDQNISLSELTTVGSFFCIKD